jgi:23S rRNA (uracil1939-C5)-methyltransferase
MVSSYAETLAARQAEIEALFPGARVDPIQAMQDPYHYRHKVYASFWQTGSSHLQAGMYEEDSHHLVPVPDCAIQHQTANRIVQQVCHIADSMHLSAYDERRGTGVLRHLYIRISHASGKAMVVVAIGSRELPGARYFVAQLVSHCPEVETIVLNWNTARTSMILGRRMKVLYGRGYVEDEIEGLRFRISPSSFYQVNPEMMLKLYQKALTLADLQDSDSVLDAYCGIGTLTLLAARRCRQAEGVECNEEAVQDARKNAARNHVDHVRFYAQDAGLFLQRARETYQVVLADPPRAGLSRTFLDALLEKLPPRFVYISCNPETQARDVKALLPAYRLVRVVPMDCFPWTKHIEAIVLLKRTNS